MFNKGTKLKCPECGDLFTVDVPEEQGDTQFCLVCQERMDPSGTGIEPDFEDFW